MSAATPTPGVADATGLLNAASQGDRAAADQLLPIVYEQLRRAAQLRMAAERPDHTLSATVIVHEAYLKLIGPRDLPWAGRGHFYSAAAEAMRQILLDHARQCARLKRGGGKAVVDLDAGLTLGAAVEESVDFVALDEAMRRLEAKDPRAAQVVRLRYFAGLSIEYTALAIGISERTVKNDWAFSRAWLARELRE